MQRASRSAHWCWSCTGDGIPELRRRNPPANTRRGTGREEFRTGRKVAPLPKSVRHAGKTCRSRDQRGFTLIDMLFVVGLVGLLSVMALPGFLRARGAAQASSALGTM